MSGREARDVGEQRRALDPVGHLEVGSRAPSAGPGRCTPRDRRASRSTARSTVPSSDCSALCGSLSMGSPGAVHSARDRPRLPPLDRSRPAGRRRGPRLDDPRRGRARVPRRGRRRDRRQRRPRPGVDRPRPRRSRPARLAYAHGSAFTTEPLEAYAAEIGPRLPVDDPAIYPVSGGSEAIETALKLARAYHLARGETDRWIVVSPAGAATTATRSARSTCRAGGRCAGRTRAGSAGSGTCRRPTRTAPASPAPTPSATRAGARRRARADASRPPGPGTRRGVRRRADRRGDARARPCRRTTTGRAIAEVCRRHGVLLIADEVMTGFGRTGRWFGLDHWGVRPDILVAAKGATLRLLAVRVRRGVRRESTTRSSAAGGFVHGFTYSHAPGGAAVAREVLRILDDEDLVEASGPRASGSRTLLARAARRRIPTVGEIRGRGPDGRPGARRRPRDARAVPARGAPDRARRPGGPRARASSSTPGRATRTASTATRSCSGRRSSSPTTSSSGSPTASRARSRRRRRGLGRPGSGAGCGSRRGAARRSRRRSAATRSPRCRAGGSPTAPSRRGRSPTAAASPSRRRGRRGPPR